MTIKIKNFKIKNRKFSIKTKKCENFLSKALGLIFRKNPKPLLFIFEKSSKKSIHSFFCIPFIAIWFLNNKIVDIKLVDSYKFYIKPKEKFNQLLEIPSNNKDFLALYEIVKNIN